MKVLVLNNWDEGMATFFHEHIDHCEHEVWYLCNKDGERGVANFLSPGMTAGKTVVKDIRDEKELLEAASEIYREFKFERVVAIDEYTVLEGAKVREKLNVHGPKINDILPYRDKKVMKNKLQGSEIKPIGTLNINDLSETNFTPCVIKSSDQAAAQGIHICKSFAELEKLRDKVDTNIFEEYVEGDIFYIDGVYNSEGVTIIANRYIGNCYDHYNYQTSLGGIPVEKSELVERIQAYSEKIVEIFPLDRGIFHLEIIHSKSDELIFLEIACRVGGGECYNLTKDIYGIDLVKHHVLSDLDLDWKLPTRKSGMHGGFLIINNFPDEKRNYLGFKCDVLTKDNNMYKASFPLFGREMSIFDSVSFCFKSQEIKKIEQSIDEVNSSFELL